MYVKFLDSKEFIDCTVVPSGNVVTMKFVGNVVVDTSGFRLYLDEKGEYDIGGDDYLGFTTIYRNDEETEKYNGYQLSNDGSIWTEPTGSETGPVTPVEPYVPTLEEIIEQKVLEMNTQQQQTIQGGVNVTLTDGTVEHFTLTDHDQTSLMGLQTMVFNGTEKIPWHTSDQSKPCKYYSNEDMQLILTSAMGYIAYHVTYFRDLRIYIRSMQTKEEVEATFYGMKIPVEFQSEPLQEMLVANQ